jgi:tetratricopeptide (TPR) repeat protein
VNPPERGVAATGLPPAAFDALLDEAIELHHAWRLDDAEARYRHLLERAPDHPDVLQRLGAALAARGGDDDLDEAITLLQRAVALTGAPTERNAGLHNNLGNALRRAKQTAAAEQVLHELVTAVPRDWQAWHNIGQLYNEQGRYDEAAGALRRSVALEPTYAESHAVLGAVLINVGRLNAAVASLRRALELGGNEYQSYSYLGIVHRQLGDLREAERCFRIALERLPNVPAAHSNLAVVLTQMGRFGEAAAAHDRAVALAPDDVSLVANRAYSALTAGDIPAAWEGWEHSTGQGPRGREREVAVPRWRGEDLSDQTVMVYREQGVGDEVLFASCYPDLIEAAGRVVIETDPRVASLFARSFPRATVRAQTVDAGWRERLAEPDFDVAVPCGSLPTVFRRTLADFPDRESYLVADPELVVKWGERLATAPGPRVGISWRSKLMTAERRLEYTRLAEWERVFGVAGASFFNLQYDECERDLADAQRRFGVAVQQFDDVDYMNDFETVAAIIANLDLVIAPRNAVAMLAGALGVPTVMMGNRWDWSDLGTDTCPWLPSVTLVFRELGQEWDRVLATAARRVEDLVRTRSTRPEQH